MIGDRLKFVMKKHGIGQKELSDATGIPINTLGHMIRNESEPNFYNVRKIAFYLKEDLNWLAYGRAFEVIKFSENKRVEDFTKIDCDPKLDQLYYSLNDVDIKNKIDDISWFEKNIKHVPGMIDFVHRFNQLKPKYQKMLDVILNSFLNEQEKDNQSGAA
ncbi:helix-turn-helix transcriptional regulator [bacterium]|nr:helix-turn-helix transcriptional regulator [bacterium]